MTGNQHELDQFSSKGKQLVSELKKIPDCDSQMLKKDMETLVDQWLDVSLTAVMMMMMVFLDLVQRTNVCV